MDEPVSHAQTQGSGEICRPPLILLDGRDLNNIRDLRAGRPSNRGGATDEDSAYLTMDRALHEGRATLVVPFAHTFEWVANRSEDEFCALMAVVETATSYAYLLQDFQLCLWEALRECHRLDTRAPLVKVGPICLPSEMGESIGDLRVIQGWWTESLGPEPSSLAESPGPSASRSLHAYRTLRPRLAQWEEAKRYHHENFRTTRAAFSAIGRSEKRLREAIVDWMCRFFSLDTVLASRGIQKPREMIREIDLVSCPAIELSIQVLRRFVQSRSRTKDNDMADLTIVSGVPHASASLMERGMASLVSQALRGRYAARVFTRASRLLQLESLSLVAQA